MFWEISIGVNFIFFPKMMRNSIFDLENRRSTYTQVNTVSIPRLELQAAVLASRLAKTIQEESRTEFEAIKFFTDSTITLSWIQNPSRNFKPFVSSRAGEIQSDSDPWEWRQIPGEENVADDISRRIHARDLNVRRTHGPEFLQKPEKLCLQAVRPFLIVLAFLLAFFVVFS